MQKQTFTIHGPACLLLVTELNYVLVGMEKTSFLCLVRKGIGIYSISDFPKKQTTRTGEGTMLHALVSHAVDAKNMSANAEKWLFLVLSTVPHNKVQNPHKIFSSDNTMSEKIIPIMIRICSNSRTERAVGCYGKFLKNVGLL